MILSLFYHNNTISLKAGSSRLFFEDYGMNSNWVSRRIYENYISTLLETKMKPPPRFLFSSYVTHGLLWIFFYQYTGQSRSRLVCFLHKRSRLTVYTNRNFICFVIILLKRCIISTLFVIIHWSSVFHTFLNIFSNIIFFILSYFLYIIWYFELWYLTWTHELTSSMSIFFLAWIT